MVLLSGFFIMEQGSLPYHMSFAHRSQTKVYTFIKSPLFLSCLLLCTLTWTNTWAQIIPRKCANGLSILDRRCCPIGADGSPCNIAFGKGHCTKIDPPKWYKPNILKRFPGMQNDDRFMWPVGLFQHIRRKH